MSSDISDLLVSQPLPLSAVHGDDTLMKAADQGAPQGATNNSTVVTAMVGSVAGVMLVVSMLMVGNAWRRRRRQQESDKGVIIQDMSGFMEVSYIRVGTNSHHCNLSYNLLCFSCSTKY